MSGDADIVKKFEREEMLFRGYEGKVTFEMFDAHIFRVMRLKYGVKIGNALWRDELPKIVGGNSLGDYEFKQHCTDVLNAISKHNATRAKMLGEENSPFWSRAWQLEWRAEEWQGLHDLITMKCRGQAALCMEELDMSKGNTVRKHLMKHFGGASEDVKFREMNFEKGMPKRTGEPAFPTGIDIESKLRQLKKESMALRKMCPIENRDTYEYGQEKTLVKIIMKHLQSTEYKLPLKELMLEMKMERMVDRKARLGVNATREELEAEADVDDWEYRNYKDEWVPSFERLRMKLMSYYKEKKFHMAKNADSNGTRARTIPSMLVNKLIDEKIKVLFAPGFGQQPKRRGGQGGNSMAPRCWACNEVGHRRGSPECKKGKDDVHPNAPQRAQKRKNKDTRMNVKPRGGICKFYSETGRCRFGAKCKFSHDNSSAEKETNYKRMRLSNKQKDAIKALKVDIDKTINGESSSHIDQVVKGFWMIKILPRQTAKHDQMEIAAMNVNLVEDEMFAYDTGSAEGISTKSDDFVYLDDSTEAKNSIKIKGPSVGAPDCLGRGPLVFTFNVNGRLMGLLHPNGILANTGEGGIEFRLASAVVMKQKGIRYVGGKFDENDFIECLRSGVKIPTYHHDGITTVQTNGVAKDIEASSAFKEFVKEVESGNASPLFDVKKFLKRSNSLSKRNTRQNAESEAFMRDDEGSGRGDDHTTVCMLMNESRLNADELARLYCRRFGYPDPAIFPIMANKPEFGKFPKLKQLNEDNIGADLAKLKRSAYKRNKPEDTMDSPPWWRVKCDAYGGQNSLGGTSHEGAKGVYIFCCASTGSTDPRLYATHDQFPVCLHQFLVRVQAEFWTCRVIYVDTHSVNLSADVEEVLALFQVQLVPVSAGTPQEMAFAESRVRVIKRMSTAMLTGAPHLSNKMWALADKYAIFVSDFLPQQTRGNLCPYYLRTGRPVDWKLIQIKVFGAPCVFAPMDGPIHKRAPIAEEGFFLGYQWPAALIMRKSDNKILSVSRQKLRVYEEAYIGPLRNKIQVEAIAQQDNERIINPDVVNGAGANIENTERADANADYFANGEMVQSIKYLRDHRLPLPGRQHRPITDIEESAQFGNASPVCEGIYIDKVLQTPIEQLANLIAEHQTNGMATKQALIKAIRETSNEIKRNELAKGKSSGSLTGVSSDNIVPNEAKRQRTIQRSEDKRNALPGKAPTKRKKKSSTYRRPLGKKKRVAKIGDLISVAPELFDETPGSYSKDYPERVMGTVKAIDKRGVATISWIEDNSTDEVKLRDLTVEKRKWNPDEVVIMLEIGTTAAYESKEKNSLPRNFFEALVRKDWRKWVEAVKKEIAGWDDNNAVSVVNISEVPHSAKIVPLGELFSIKRSGTYKFRQYLMGNLLRPGLDFEDSYSTTISSTGTTIFFALATSSGKIIYGWDAICGYLQTKEQFDIFAYLPSHEGYSSLEYEEIAEFRKSLLKILEESGMVGIKKFAAAHKKQYRSHPDKVYKCNASIYGDPSAGSEFEKLMNSVHTQTAGMKQTQPEPSMYVKINTNKDDQIIGYIVVIAFVDDVRMFGTEPELTEYKKAVSSRLKVTFDEPPILEFISIETYQDLDNGTCELKMPKYFCKAANFFKEFIKGDIHERLVPITVHDENIMLQAPTEEEVKEAKDLPYLRAVGILSYPASNCKFEMRYAVSLVGSRRTGWSRKQFNVVVKLFEYAHTTRDIGLMFSKGLDPHGMNTLYAYADASHRVPRPQGCRIVMMNGAAVSFVSKKQTLTAPSTCWAETVTQFDCSTDVLGLRNLMAELGMYQEYPTTIYQDNMSAIRIANNRGSLGKASRAMDIKTLSVRNRIEDHQVCTKYVETKNMVADIGTKALPENPFIRLRDIANGYALVRAKFPRKAMCKHVYSMPDEKRGSLPAVQAMIMSYSFQNENVCCEEYFDEADWEEEEVDSDEEPLSAYEQLPQEIYPSTVYSYQRHPLYPRSHRIMQFDELPDPRLYNIDVGQLYAHVMDYVANPTSDNAYNSFWRYLQNFESDIVDDAFRRHKQQMIDDPLPFSPTLFLPADLGQTTQERQRNVMKSMYRYASAQERTVHQHVKEEVTNNVIWKEFSAYPDPSPSWIRWQRWRCYFLNRVFTFLTEGLRPEDLPCEFPYGPPPRTDRDRHRATLTNWFFLNANDGQFHKVDVGFAFQDEIPDVTHLNHVQERSIVMWSQITIWTLDPSEYSRSDFWNRHAQYPQCNVLSTRLQRLAAYGLARTPRWGRNNLPTTNSAKWGTDERSAQKHTNTSWGDVIACDEVPVDEDQDQLDGPPKKRIKVGEPESERTNWANESSSEPPISAVSVKEDSLRTAVPDSGITLSVSATSLVDNRYPEPAPEREPKSDAERSKSPNGHQNMD